MAFVNHVIRHIIRNCIDYCCLCLEAINEKDISYNLRDEIISETANVEDINEILHTVVGEQVMNSLSSSTICQKCTMLAINSYKFIESCKNNVLKLSNIFNCLQNFSQNAPRYNYCPKSLFLALDTVNYTIDEFYDKKKCHTSGESLHYTFQQLLANSLVIQNIGTSITLDIQPENCNTNVMPELDETLKIPTIQEDLSCKRKMKSRQNSVVKEGNITKKSYKCECCLKEYQSGMKLKLHHQRVHAPKTFKCGQCPRSFGSSLILNRHVKNSHRSAVCSYCGKTYNNSYSLRHHEKSHKVSFKCKSCGKVYKGKQSFNNHVEQNLCHKVRNSKPNYECSLCGKKYSNISALNVHLRLEHENGKVLICDWCGKKLSSQSRLKEHIIKHTKQKNFQCDLCGEKFVTKTSLLYHTRTHTGEKPYKCEHCDLKFLSASRRSEHVQRYHAGPDLECDICHSQFKGKTYLMRHKKRHFNVSSKLYHFSANKLLSD